MSYKFEAGCPNCEAYNMYPVPHEAEDGDGLDINCKTCKAKLNVQLFIIDGNVWDVIVTEINTTKGALNE